MRRTTESAFVVESGHESFPRTLTIRWGPKTAARAYWRLHVKGYGSTWPKGVKVTSTVGPTRMWYFKFTTIMHDGTPVEVGRRAWIRLMGLVLQKHRI